MLHSSCNASTSVCMQKITNLSINTTVWLTKLVRMQWLTRCTLILNFQNVGSASRWRSQWICIMDTWFELRYKAVAEFKWRFTSNFWLCQLCNGSWVDRSLRQRGQENEVINTPQLYMPIVMEGEIVDVNMRLKQVVRQWLSRTSSGWIASNFQRPG